MRAKTSDFVKVVNRARPEQKTTEKKTITWVHVFYLYQRFSDNKCRFKNREWHINSKYLISWNNSSPLRVVFLVMQRINATYYQFTRLSFSLYTKTILSCSKCTSIVVMMWIYSRYSQRVAPITNSSFLWADNDWHMHYLVQLVKWRKHNATH